jgi:hypothetical protein
MELQESDYTPEQVKIWATHAAKEFIQRMDETYAFCPTRSPATRSRCS